MYVTGRIENWSVSPSVDMVPFGVTIPATVPQRSEFPEGLMNYPVYIYIYIYIYNVIAFSSLCFNFYLLTKLV